MADNSKTKLHVWICLLPIALLAGVVCYRQYQSETAPRRLKGTIRSLDEEIRRAGFKKGSDGHWSVLLTGSTAGATISRSNATNASVTEDSGSNLNIQLF